MKLCLVIPGGSITRTSACRVLDGLGFTNTGQDDGLYAYSAGGGLDVMVIDWYQQKAGLKERLETLRDAGQPVILFCAQGAERDHLEKVLGDERDQWTLRPFSMDVLVETLA